MNHIRENHANLLEDDGMARYRKGLRDLDRFDENDNDLRTLVFLQARKIGSHNANNFLRRNIRAGLHEIAKKLV